MMLLERTKGVLIMHTGVVVPPTPDTLYLLPVSVLGSRGTPHAWKHARSPGSILSPMTAWEAPVSTKPKGNFAVGMMTKALPKHVGTYSCSS